MGCGKSKGKNPSLKVGGSEGGSSNVDANLKLLLVGDAGVGKSSLLLRYTDNTFSENFVNVGVDFKDKHIKVGDQNLKMQIWDTAGQEKFRTITSSFYRGAQAIILVYDITSPESFKNMNRWVQELERYANDDVIKLLVGNKSDLEKDRQVPTEQGKKLADQLGLKFFETSAKTPKCVDETFMTLAQEFLNRNL